MAAPAQQLRQRGFVVVRGLLASDEVAHYRALLLETSGIDPLEHRSTGRGTSGWNVTDGVTKSPDFWDLIFHERLRAAVSDALDGDIRYLQHSDLQVGFSAIAWHRDNVNRTYGEGPDWDESDGPYGLVRVGIYLQEFGQSGFRLGFIPGSHRLDRSLSPSALRRREWGFKLQGGAAYLGPRFQRFTRSSVWIATEPGDAIVFDPRILHSGSYIRGLKLSMFVGYGIQNRHFADLRNYYLHVRRELGYQPIPDALAVRLQREGLYPEAIVDSDDVEGAYRPAAPLRKLVERRVR